MIAFYHPSKSGKGFASSFQYSKKDNTVYAQIIKQYGWDDESQTGTFKESMKDPNKKISIKLSPIEVSAIIDCIERNRTFKTFHDNSEFPKTINFSQWIMGDVSKGFSFSVGISSKQDSEFKNSFYIGLTFPEARYLREYLVFCLNEIFINAGASQYNPATSVVEKQDDEDLNANF